MCKIVVYKRTTGFQCFLQRQVLADDAGHHVVQVRDTVEPIAESHVLVQRFKLVEGFVQQLVNRGQLGNTHHRKVQPLGAILKEVYGPTSRYIFHKIVSIEIQMAVSSLHDMTETSIQLILPCSCLDVPPHAEEQLLQLLKKKRMQDPSPPKPDS